jgi:hypothetical protein
MQAPQSNSPILTEENTILELNRLKGVMKAKYADWDIKAAESGSRFFNPEHRLATRVSKFYKSLAALAVAYGSPSVYDDKYHEVTKAQDALTYASLLSHEVRNQLDIDKSNVVFTVFARIATCSGTLSFIVDFGPCREASKAYFENFGSRARGFLQVSCRRLQSCEADHLQKTVVDLTGTHVVPLTKIY